jgi:hypothetical protein
MGSRTPLLSTWRTRRWEIQGPPGPSSNHKPQCCSTCDKGWKEGADGSSTPEAKLFFDLPGRCEGATQRKWANANPFEALNGEDDASNFLKKAWKLWKEAGFSKGKISIRLKLI